jgi:hypothetical protein
MGCEISNINIATMVIKIHIMKKTNGKNATQNILD